MRWTKKDDDALRVLFRKGKSDAELGSALGRSELAVRKRRHATGLKRQPEPSPGPRWGPGEVETLLSGWEDGLTHEAIAAQLTDPPRTPVAVRRKCHRLGLKRDTRVWSEDQATMLSILLYRGLNDDAIAKKLGKTPEAVEHKRRDLAVSRDTAWTPAELRMLGEARGRKTATEIAAILPGRSRKAVERKIERDRNRKEAHRKGV